MTSAVRRVVARICIGGGLLLVSYGLLAVPAGRDWPLGFSIEICGALAIVGSLAYLCSSARRQS